MRVTVLSHDHQYSQLLPHLQVSSDKSLTSELSITAFSDGKCAHYLAYTISCLFKVKRLNRPIRLFPRILKGKDRLLVGQIISTFCCHQVITFTHFQRRELLATLCYTNQILGALCFNFQCCTLAIKQPLVEVAGHDMLRKRGHFFEKITAV